MTTLETMPTATKIRPTDDTATPAGNLAKLEAEIANLPAEIDAAIDAGDEMKVASLTARERILARQLAPARRAALEAKLEPLLQERREVGDEQRRVDGKVRELEFARDVYAAAAERLAGGPSGLVYTRAKNLERRIEELRNELAAL